MMEKIKKIEDVFNKIGPCFSFIKTDTMYIFRVTNSRKVEEVKNLAQTMFLSCQLSIEESFDVILDLLENGDLVDVLKKSYTKPCNTEKLIKNDLW